jgi:hypothetical protein
MMAKTKQKKKKRQPKLSKTVVPTKPTNKIAEMTDAQLMNCLNNAHNIIHECDNKIAEAQLNINNIMAFMNQKKEDPKK